MADIIHFRIQGSHGKSKSSPSLMFAAN